MAAPIFARLPRHIQDRLPYDWYCCCCYSPARFSAIAKIHHGFEMPTEFLLRPASLRH